jgi:superfamily II DNA or RNA helicase
VVVPTVDLLHQWVTRLRERLWVPVGTAGDGTLDSFEHFLVIVCVARTAAEFLPAAVRRISASAEVLLVADECHRYGAATYAMALDAPYAATLGLSATPERNHDDGIVRYVVPALGPVIYEYVQDEAIADRVIADFRMLFVGLEFAEVEQARYGSVASELARAWRLLSVRFPALEEAQNQVEAVKLLVDGEADGDARLWLSLNAERRRLLSNSSARHAFVGWCARRGLFADHRSIVFHESIADCESIVATMQAAGMRAASHHSQLKSTERASVLRRFRDGTVSVLVAPRTLDEGIDVPDASLAMIAAGTRVKRQTIQRIGRVLRRAPGKETAKVVKLYVHGAADDPAAPGADAYTRALLARDGTVCLTWPADEAAIAEFLTG